MVNSNKISQPSELSYGRPSLCNKARISSFLHWNIKTTMQRSAVNKIGKKSWKYIEAWQRNISIFLQLNTKQLCQLKSVSHILLQYQRARRIGVKHNL